MKSVSLVERMLQRALLDSFEDVHLQLVQGRVLGTQVVEQDGRLQAGPGDRQHELVAGRVQRAAGVDSLRQPLLCGGELDP